MGSGESFQSRIHGQADLDGTHRVIIESPRADSIRQQAQSDSAVARIVNGDFICGCLVAEIRPSVEEIIRVDRFKQTSLRTRDGDMVKVDFISPAEAVQVRLEAKTDFLERDFARLIGKPVIRSETTAVFALAGEPRVARVVETKPEGIVLVGPATQFITRSKAVMEEEAPLAYEDIGGLEREVKAVRELIEYPLKSPALFDHFGVMPPKGVILYGPPGTGKTLLLRALVNEVGARFFVINGPEIFSKWYGESEKQLRQVFEDAAKHVPALILIDELDALAPKRDSPDSHHGELERRIVATLLTLMDGVTRQKGVVVVGTTNRLNAIDSALRRPGRFGSEVHIGVPDMAGREKILRIHTRRMPLEPDVHLKAIAERASGFVGADLASLCREAAYGALRRTQSGKLVSDLEPETYENLQVGMQDFDAAFASVPPSALREFVVEIPKVSWKDIGGLEEVKRLLIENVVYPITRLAAFRKAGVKPARGVLLHGPPGTGKTMLAKAVAHECHVNFISVRGPELVSKWQGESAERIRFLFSKAREASPCLIFFDEIDSAVPARRGTEYSTGSDAMVNQILCELDGVQSSEGLFVIGAANRPELLDPALLRTGRFDYQIEIPLPDPTARKAIFAVHLDRKPMAPGLDMDAMSDLTDGFSGSDIAEACRRSAMAALKEADFQEEAITLRPDHLEKAIEAIRGSLRVKKMKPGFLAAIALAAALALPSPGRAATDVMVVAQNSASMRWADPQHGLPQTLSSWLGGLGSGTRTGVVIAGARADLVKDLEQAAPVDALQGLTYRGPRSNLAAAVERAIYELREHGKADDSKAVIIVGDGRGADSRWLRESLAAEAKKWKIRVYTAILGEKADVQTAQVLGQSTDGSYYRVSSLLELTLVLGRIVGDLSQSPQPKPQTQAEELKPLAAPSMKLWWLLPLAALLAVAVFLVWRPRRGLRHPPVPAQEPARVEPAAEKPGGLSQIRELGAAASNALKTLQTAVEREALGGYRAAQEAEDRCMSLAGECILTLDHIEVLAQTDSLTPEAAKAISAVRKRVRRMLESAAIEEVPVECGTPFDNLTQVPSSFADNGGPEGMVQKVERKGYTMKSASRGVVLLRPAAVVVSRRSEHHGEGGNA